ncbi:MAG: sigma-70 family RNA polymerase sigma factor [Clostridia bacterium]|nr:sigma-70 family RNA polymerase sigma factor [Clostridia bacterium]
MQDKEEDRMLLMQARSGDKIALENLLNKFRPMVNRITRGYFLTNGDDDDLAQEGMIGLYKAFLTYEINSDVAFGTFAYLCVKRQVLQAVRSSMSAKNSPLSNYLSIDPHGSINMGDDEDEEGAYYIPSDSPSPEENFLTKESMNELNIKIKSVLSDYEYSVLLLYLKGFSYKQISLTLDKNPKSVDNAIGRIRDKLQFLH